MYELCRLLAPKKNTKVRKPAKPAARVGAVATLTINQMQVTLIERDTRAKGAWFVADQSGNRLPYSFARDVLVIA